jgi:hypothetical protein
VGESASKRSALAPSRGAVPIDRVGRGGHNKAQATASNTESQATHKAAPTTKRSKGAGTDKKMDQAEAGKAEPARSDPLRATRAFAALHEATTRHENHEPPSSESMDMHEATGRTANPRAPKPRTFVLRQIDRFDAQGAKLSRNTAVSYPREGRIELRRKQGRQKCTPQGSEEMLHSVTAEYLVAGGGGAELPLRNVQLPAQCAEGVSWRSCGTKRSNAKPSNARLRRHTPCQTKPWVLNAGQQQRQMRTHAQKETQTVIYRFRMRSFRPKDDFHMFSAQRKSTHSARRPSADERASRQNTESTTRASKARRKTTPEGRLTDRREADARCLRTCTHGLDKQIRSQQPRRNASRENCQARKVATANNARSACHRFSKW